MSDRDRDPYTLAHLSPHVQYGRSYGTDEGIGRREKPGIPEQNKIKPEMGWKETGHARRRITRGIHLLAPRLQSGQAAMARLQPDISGPCQEDVATEIIELATNLYKQGNTSGEKEKGGALL